MSNLEHLSYTFNDVFSIIRIPVYILLIIAGGLLLNKFFGGFLRKTIRPEKIAGKLSEKRAETLIAIAIGVTKYAVCFIMAYAVLNIVFSGRANPLLAVMGAVGVAIGFGAQGIIRDVVAGFFIILEGQFSIGDIVEIAGQFGTVESMSLRITTLRGNAGQFFIIPNGDIKTIVNWSNDRPLAVVHIPVSYNEDIDRILSVLESEMDKFQSENVLDKAQIVGVTELDRFNLTVRITAKCEIGTNWAVERAIRRVVLARFKTEGIKPPVSAMIEM